ncbi:hypothetical protein HZS_3591 [Henneguya salminicola]|nr:hypothetical protein HZS_3591 [Henneguya salminicola]
MDFHTKYFQLTKLTLSLIEVVFILSLQDSEKHKLFLNLASIFRFEDYKNSSKARNSLPKRSQIVRIFDDVEIIFDSDKITLSWVSDVTSDLTADTILAVILETKKNEKCLDNLNCNKILGDEEYLGLIEIFKKNFGSTNVIKLEDNSIHIIFGESKKAVVDPSRQHVVCDVQKVKEKIERTLFHYSNSIKTFCNCKCK